MNCKNCDQDIQDGEVVCTSCGSKLQRELNAEVLTQQLKNTTSGKQAMTNLRVKLPHPLEVLASERASVPEWLANYSPEHNFPREQFFASRIIYYPGSGLDGHPLRIWGKSHSAHCFVFVDYGVHKNELHEILSDENHRRHPRGYRPVHIIDLLEKDLTPRGWRPHIRVHHRGVPAFAQVKPFALWTVLERTEHFGDDHGPERLAILCIGGDGIATFDALFCQEPETEVFGLLLQDHGFGCNWSHFGGESYLSDLALKHAPPKWILIGDNTEVWNGYSCVSSSDIGGMNYNSRRLFIRNNRL